MQRIIESPISKSAQVDWEREIEYALRGGIRVLERNGYSVPCTILWDGIHSKPGAILKEDLFVFTLSIYNTNEMPVYSVSEVGVKARSYWHDRRTKAVKLDLIGFMDRIEFCNKFSRKLKTPQRTMWCYKLKKNINLSMIEDILDRSDIEKTIKTEEQFSSDKNIIRKKIRIPSRRKIRDHNTLNHLKDSKREIVDKMTDESGTFYKVKWSSTENTGIVPWNSECVTEIMKENFRT